VRRFLWGFLIVLLLVVAVLVARGQEGFIAGMDEGDLAALIIAAALLLFVGTTVFALFRDRLSQGLLSALAWIGVGLLLAIGYSYRTELRDVGDRVLTQLVPGRPATRGRTVEIARTSSGSFSVTTQVNGVRVPMVLDTGATAVVLTYEAAKAAGLPLEVIAYTVNVDTANGRTRAAPVTLDRVAIGGIIERAVPALIAQPGRLRTSLLGMTFLNRLESWEVRSDRLLMRAYP
jgi:aspartyl protease family protein